MKFIEDYTVNVSAISGRDQHRKRCKDSQPRNWQKASSWCSGKNMTLFSLSQEKDGITYLTLLYNQASWVGTNDANKLPDWGKNFNILSGVHEVVLKGWN